ncbi:MAG: lysoplasmalogenase [Bacteroidia bacterium]|nr:lysoplasmalogenase [Bacteroidia bacterium]
MNEVSRKPRTDKGIRLKKFSIFVSVFSFIFLAELTAEFFYEIYPGFYYVIKPLIVSSLIIYYLYVTWASEGLFDLMMLMAFLFSLVGDILLMFSGTTWFIAGIGSFLMAQLCYISLFGMKMRSTPRRMRRLLVRKPWLIAPVVLYGSVLTAILFPNLGTFTIPVSVYSAVLVGMVLAAMNRWEFTSVKSFVLVFVGAILFMFSDSMIALNKFGDYNLPSLFVRFWIMGTYMAAQFLIVWGILVERKQPKPQVLGMN